MLSVEQIQTVIDTLKAENRLLARLVKQRLLEHEHKSYEHSVCRVPEIEKVLAGSEAEFDELVERYRL